MSAASQDIERARQLADRLDCLLEEDLILLTGATSTTVENWRKRHTGPRWVRFGQRVLYPRASVAEHLADLAAARPTSNLTPKDLL